MSARPRFPSLFTTALAVALAIAGGRLTARSPQLAQFRGDWVPQSSTCTSAVRFRVDEKTMTLINGKDSQTWGNVATPSGFFGPEYRGISVVALPDFDGTQPFTVYFNSDEKKGLTKVEIYVEMKGQLNPQLAKIQAAAKQLATRFPLNNMLLKKCPA